ncbi:MULTISPECIES: hypothetical protein [unclassified Sporolactobacillus]|nr:hypothetical protein [Sporolactobacillus sp. CQH2019]MDD9148060.1 hypothetical protein [Sporolactobacillus sp. CQH2019]
MHNPNAADEIKEDQSTNLRMNEAADGGCNEWIIVNPSVRGPNSDK